MTNTDRTLPVVIYGFAPVEQPTWHKSKKYHREGDEYFGDELRNSRDHRRDVLPEMNERRWLTLEPQYPQLPEQLSGHTRAKIMPERAPTIAPFQCPANATTIYCVKTGQPVGTLLQASEHHPSAVAPDWYQDDGRNLDTLQEQQPRAYVAYCLGIVDTFWRSTAHRSQKRDQAKEHHWSLVRAYELLGAISDGDLMELATACCHFLTYAPLSYRVLDQRLLPGRRAADLMAESAVAGALLGVMQKATVRTLVAAENFAKAGASVKTPKFEIAPTSMLDAAKGPSNIRAQVKGRDKMSKLMADIVREFGNELGWKQDKKAKTQSQGLLARLSKHSDHSVQRMAYSEASDQERDLLDGLDEIMQGGFGADDMEIDDDDIAEVRSIPRQLVESLAETVVAPIPTAPKKLTLLERIARQKENQNG